MWCFSRHKTITVWLFNSTPCHVSRIYSPPTEDCAADRGHTCARQPGQQLSPAARIAKPQSNMYSEFAARTHIRFLSMCGNDEAPGYDGEFIVLRIPGGPHYQAQGTWTLFISRSTWTRHKHGSLKGLKPPRCVAAWPSLICECVLVQGMV